MKNLVIQFLMTWGWYNIDGFLIRSNDVYGDLIEKIHDQSESNSLVLLYASTDLHPSQDIEAATQLVKLQRYFNKVFISTKTTDIKTFASQPNKDFDAMSKVLFVFLHDSDDVRKEFTTFLAPVVQLSRQIWLMFLDDETKIDIFFQDIYIPANCDFMVSQRNLQNNPGEIISEIYKLTETGNLISKVLTKWSPKIAFKLRDVPLSQSRNWEGTEIRLSVLHNPPESIIVHDVNNTVKENRGSSGDTVSLIADSLNLTKRYIEAYEYGRPVNGTRTGATGDVGKKISDMFLCIVWVIPEGVGKADYLFPTISVTYRIYIKKTFKSTKWDKFLDPFSDGIWMVFGVSIFVVSGVISAIVFIRKTMLKQRIDIDNQRSTFMNDVFIIFGLVCNQTGDLQPSTSPSTRIAYLTISVTLIVIFAAYSAVLISSLAINVYHPPFTTLEEFINDRSYKLGVIDAHDDDQLFEPNDKNLLKIFKKMVSKGREFYPNNYEDGLIHACKDDKYAFISLDSIVEFFEYKDCVLYPTKVKAEIPSSFLMQKNNLFKESMNIKLFSLMEYGILKKIRSDYKKKKENLKEPFLAAVEISDVMPIMIFLAAIIFLSSLILCGEIIVHRIIMKQRLNKMILKRVPKRMLVAEKKLHGDKYKNIEIGKWMLYRQKKMNKRLNNNTRRHL